MVERLSKDVNEIVKSPAFREKLSGFGNIQFATNTPDTFSELIKSDIRFWDKVLKDAKVEPQ